jgi:Zn-dependent peptidase ImmA (M78 family)
MKTYSEIEKIISDNFVEFSEHDFSLPIYPEKLAKDKKITVIFEEMEDTVSGFLIIKDSKKTIIINKNHHENRQRFTIAHELGHYILHAKGKRESLFIDKKQVYNRNLKSSDGTNIQEIEANRFAASILMPKVVILDHITNAGEPFYEFSDDETSISYLAKMLAVSNVAMTHRLSSLLIP